MIGRGVCIVGAGAGGISAAIWAQRLGLNPVIYEKDDRVGGQLLDVHNPLHDYLGLPVDRGSHLQPTFAAHLEKLKIPIHFQSPVTLEDPDKRQMRVGNTPMHYDFLVIATGARRAALNCPGEIAFTGKGVSNSATRDKSLFAGQSVAVIGGGDAAAENALILSAICPEVYVVIRGDKLSARKIFKDRIAEKKNIHLLFNHRVKAFEGADRLERLIFETAQAPLAVRGACVRIGVTPNTEFLGSLLEKDTAGYLKVNGEQGTSIPRIFAVGDVCNPHFSSVICAAAHGMVAAKSISNQWESQW